MSLFLAGLNSYAETYYYLEEAKLALAAIKRAGLPSVVTLSLPASGKLRDGHSIADACKILEDEGADVVGMNCYRGPSTALSAVSAIRKRVSGHVAALPVPYRTTDEHPTFFCSRIRERIWYQMTGRSR